MKPALGTFVRYIATDGEDRLALVVHVKNEEKVNLLVYRSGPNDNIIGQNAYHENVVIGAGSKLGEFPAGSWHALDAKDDRRETRSETPAEVNDRQRRAASGT